MTTVLTACEMPASYVLDAQRVRMGYKQTDVGVIPEDWGFDRLTSIADVRDGTHDSPRYTKSGIPFVTSKNILAGKIDFQDITFITEDDANEVNKRSKVDRNDILMSMIGTVGNAALVDFEPEFCIKNVALIKPNISKIVPHYLIQLFRSTLYGRYIDNKLDGGIQKFISLSVLRGLDVPLPPTKAEQEAIAEALSDADALIEALEQLITKKRHLKQGAMQELLTGKKRLPGFGGEWEVKFIGEFTDCTSGGTPSTLMPSYWNGQIRWMSSGELNLKQVFEVDGRITEEGLRNSSTKMIPANCVLVGLAGQGKTRGTVAMNRVELCTNQSIAAIFPSSAFDSEYLYYNLDARYLELRELSTGDGGRGGLNLTIIKSLKVPFPKLLEQTAIATILSDMDIEIAALEQQLAKVRGIKQGMMQELLTGRIRLV